VISSAANINQTCMHFYSTLIFHTNHHTHHQCTTKTDFKSRRTIRSSRRQSWQSFVSKINSRTSLKKVWNLVSKIAGKKSPTAVHHLTVNNNEITSELDIAKTFGHTFSSNSSSEHYTDVFNAHRKKVEKQPLKLKSNITNTQQKQTFCW